MANNQRARWDKQSEDHIRKNTKRCPKCNVPIEKNGQLPRRCLELIEILSINKVSLVQISLCSNTGSITDDLIGRTVSN